MGQRATNWREMCERDELGVVGGGQMTGRMVALVNT